MKKLIILIIALLFNGCDYEYKSKSQAYLDFTQKHGSHTRFFCDENEFLIHEFFMYSSDEVASRRLVKNDSDTPTRCTRGVTVNVKETVATGALSGSVK